MSLKLRDFDFFNRLETRYIWLLLKTALKFLISPRGDAEYWKRLRDFVLITNINFWVEVRSIVFFIKFMIMFADTASEILLDGASRILVPTSNRDVAHFRLDLSFRFVHFFDTRSNLFHFRINFLSASTTYFLSCFQFGQLFFYGLKCQRLILGFADILCFVI